MNFRSYRYGVGKSDKLTQTGQNINILWAKNHSGREFLLVEGKSRPVVQELMAFSERKVSIADRDRVNPDNNASPQRMAGIIRIPSCQVRAGLVVISTVSKSKSAGLVAMIFCRVRPTRAQRGQRIVL
jgi:hypothetical protein